MKRRQTISGGAAHHAQPFPTAVKLGNLVCSSAISGRDASGALPEALDAQIRNAFQTIEVIMREAGGSTADIAKVVVYLTDRAHREAVNPHWIAMFPDEDDRPVRHSLTMPLPAGFLIQLEIIAMLEG